MPSYLYQADLSLGIKNTGYPLLLLHRKWAMTNEDNARINVSVITMLLIPVIVAPPLCSGDCFQVP
jgi:hypothetical protein